MKPFTAITVLVLSLVSLLQLFRFIKGWEIVVNGTTVIPTWASLIAFVVLGGLALMVWREHQR